MNVSPQLRVLHVTFGEGRVAVNVRLDLVGDDGAVFPGTVIEQVTAEETDIIASAQKAGRSEWGNTDVEDIIRAAQKMVRPPIPPIPPVAAVLDAVGNVVRDAIPGRDATDAVYGPKFDPTAVIVW